MNEHVLSRIQKLEQSNSRLKQSVWLMALGIVGIAFLSGLAARGGPAQSVKAQSFVLYDSKGNERAVFATDEKGEPFLLCGEPGQKAPIAFRGDEIVLHDNKGVERARLGITGFTFQNPKKQVTAQLTTHENDGHLQLTSFAKSTPAQTDLRGTGFKGPEVVTPRVNVVNSSNKTVVLTSYDGNGGGMYLYRHDGKSAGFWKSTEESGVLCVNNSEGNPAAIVGASNDIGTVWLFDRETETVWTAPE